MTPGDVTLYPMALRFSMGLSPPKILKEQWESPPFPVRRCAFLAGHQACHFVLVAQVVRSVRGSHRAALDRSLEDFPLVDYKELRNLRMRWNEVR